MVAVKFKAESELCDAFIAALRAASFAVYPETSDFDIVAVAPATVAAHFNIEPGDQLGIHAKLRANVDVLAQAVETEPTRFQPYSYSNREPGPHWRVVLVPDASDAFKRLCTKLGVQVAKPPHMGPHDTLGNWFSRSAFAHTARRTPLKPLWVPDIELSTPCGVPAPRSITKWKLAALRLCALHASKGHLTKADFKAAKVSMSRWVDAQWIIGAKVRDEYHYTLQDTAKNAHRDPAPHVLYPDLYAQVLASTKT